MTEKDKKVIFNYMCWPDDKMVQFDLNTLGLCVDEMQEHGDDYHNFIMFARDLALDNGVTQTDLVTGWLDNPNNFFPAMTEWIKSIDILPLQRC